MTNSLTGVTRRLLVGLGLASLGLVAAAQSSYPNRPITLVSPFLAGSSADNTARQISEIASRELGQPIVIENKPGAEALIGMTDVVRAPADGYRLLWAGGGSLMGVPAMRKKPPFDPVKDFTPIAAGVDFSFFMYVHPDLPAKNMKEFIAYAQANPGKISYAVGNVQSRMIMGDLARRYKLDMVQVQYKGEVAAGADLIAGRVQAMFGTTTQLQLAKSGKLRVISTSLSKRSAIMPQVPTLREEGIEGAEFGGGWLSIVAPAGLDPAITAKLHAAYTKALADPAVTQRLQDAGLVYTPRGNGAALSEFMRSEYALYRKTAIELDLVRD